MVTKKTGGKRKRDLRRKPPSKLRKPFVLIACEGGKTEPYYFDAFRQRLKFTKEQFKILGKEIGTHPKNIVKSAKKERQKLLKDGYDYDKIWCVFDCDQHENIHEAFDQAKTNKFEVIFSNPCFELWYLLHYQDQRRHIERRDIIRELKNYLADYDKGTEGLYLCLLDRQEGAIKRAGDLRKRIVDDRKLWDVNPYTNVDELVIFLNGLEGAG